MTKPRLILPRPVPLRKSPRWRDSAISQNYAKSCKAPDVAKLSRSTLDVGDNPDQVAFIYGLNEFSQTRTIGLSPIQVQKCGRKRSLCPIYRPF